MRPQLIAEGTRLEQRSFLFWVVLIATGAPCQRPGIEREGAPRRTVAAKLFLKGFPPSTANPMIFGSMGIGAQELVLIASGAPCRVARSRHFGSWCLDVLVVVLKRCVIASSRAGEDGVLAEQQWTPMLECGEPACNFHFSGANFTEPTTIPCPKCGATDPRTSTVGHTCPECQSLNDSPEEGGGVCEVCGFGLSPSMEDDLESHPASASARGDADFADTSIASSAPIFKMQPAEEKVPAPHPNPDTPHPTPSTLATKPYALASQPQTERRDAPPSPRGRGMACRQTRPPCR